MCFVAHGPLVFLKRLNLSLKIPTLPTTAVRFFTSTSNLHKLTSFFRVHDVMSCSKDQRDLST